MHDEPVAVARDLVLELFPLARWAVLAGSVLTAHRTPGSDLDIVVVLPDGDSQAPHRDSRYYRGWPVELFVHDEQTMTYYLDKDVAERRPVLHRMIATGLPILGDPGDRPARCARVLAAGPRGLSDADREYVRYGLTDLLDDLAHAVDAGERTVIATALWTASAQQALALAGHWTGTSKWLLRELRDLDAELAGRWLAASGDPVATAKFAREVLDTAGGPLFEGYRAAGIRPRSAT
ncbi:nucleotidyltransferase domain-containing protein [Hamadaea sp. NPDC051192]|uniref:nucleotidyltransferase domain-containing protein n=1 Tax=Hamadaea sp. NPDC051192 TaxID=3154940 RepID=UPI00343DD0FF